jgi:hypothetical protein|tara:strand:- start:1210 stop:1977 length:768 start_codon:yes stop_codon:yes gene_type:complete
MASFFIYDSINMYRSDNTISEGGISGSSPNNTFSQSNSLTNHERAADQNIGTVISGVGNSEAIKYAIGSNATADVAAVYFTGASGGSNPIIRIKKGASGSITNIGEINSVSAAGWSVATLTSTTDDEFYAQFTGAISNCAEILIGKKLAFEVEPDINIQTAKDYGTQVQKSLGGVEYAINTHNGQEIFTISFQNISSTFKSDLLTFEDANKAQGKKFLYYDGTNYNWVRLDRPMVFTEVADGRFSTQIVMRQQIQ